MTRKDRPCLCVERCCGEACVTVHDKIILGIADRHEILGSVPIPTVCPSVASRNLLLYQSLPSSIPYRHAILWRRKDDSFQLACPRNGYEVTYPIVKTEVRRAPSDRYGIQPTIGRSPHEIHGSYRQPSRRHSASI